MCSKFIDDFASKHNTTVHAISYHFDEGHFDKYTGEWKDNAHVQFVFDNVNSQTGRAINSRLTKQDLRNLQSDLAKVLEPLGFERGKDYKAHNEKAPKQLKTDEFIRQQILKEQNPTKTLTREALINETLELLQSEKISSIQELKEIYNQQKNQIIQFNKDYPVDTINKITAKDWRVINEIYTANKTILGEQAKLNSAENENIELKINKLTLEQKLLDKRTELSSSDINNLKLRQENRNLKSENDYIRRDFDDSINTFNEERDKQFNENRELNKKNKELQEKLEQLNNEIRLKRQSDKELEEEKNKLKQIIEDKNAEINVRDNLITEIEQDNKDKDAEIEELEQQLKNTKIQSNANWMRYRYYEVVNTKSWTYNTNSAKKQKEDMKQLVNELNHSDIIQANLENINSGGVDLISSIKTEINKLNQILDNVINPPMQEHTYNNRNNGFSR